MQTNERLKKLLEEHPCDNEISIELSKLQDFLNEMKEAGVVVDQQYNLPQPDTIGRNATRASVRQLTTPREEEGRDKSQSAAFHW